MVRVLVTKYWVLAHLFAVAGTLCFVPQLSVGLGLWLVSSLLLMAFALPPVLQGESFWMARHRAAGAFRNNAFTYAALLALAVVLIGVWNGPRDLVYESDLRRWVYDVPKAAFLPSTIVPAEGVPFLVGLAGSLACALVTRCILPRKQRLWLLLGLAALSGILALTQVIFDWGLADGFAQSVLWLLMFCVCCGIASEGFLEGHFKTCYVALALAALNTFGIVAAGSPSVLIAMALVALLYLVFSVFIVRGSGRGPRLLWHCVMMLPIPFAAGLGLALVPEAQATVVGLFSETLPDVMADFWRQWRFRWQLGWKVFNSEALLGAGSEGFQHTATFFFKDLDGMMTRQAWALWRAGGTGLSCDFVKLMAERGMMGALFLLLPGVILLGKCLLKFVAFQQGHHRHYSYRYLFVAIGSFVGVLLTLLASFLGTPLHSPALLCCFLVVCTCLSGWMPRRR